MLSRNIIDNFIKIIKKEWNINTPYTYRAFELIFELDIVKNNKVLDYAFRQVLNLYKKSCGYVHTQEKKYMSLNNGIKNYNANKDKQLEACIKEIVYLIKNINIIFIFIFDNIYEKKLHPDEKTLIHFLCSKNELKEIFYYKYDIMY